MSECVIVLVGAEGARRELMRRVFVGLALGLAVITASLSVAALQLRADEKPPKGQDKAGTKPALVRIAGEALLNSNAFGFLTELIDDVVARVTGIPADGKPEEW